MDIRYLGSAGYDLWTEICIASGTGIGSGSIQIEPGWQLIAIPIEYGYWSTTITGHVHDGTTRAKFENYVYTQIEQIVGSGMVEVANTYVGDIQAFYSYVVGSTPTSSPHNFQLMYDDGIHREVSGFWIKSTAGSPFIIYWGEDE
jgi:hypothetical protein